LLLICVDFTVSFRVIQKAFKPALPNDAVVSFYIQAQKLVLTVYHLVTQYNKTDIAATYKVGTLIAQYFL